MQPMSVLLCLVIKSTSVCFVSRFPVLIRCRYLAFAFVLHFTSVISC